MYMWTSLIVQTGKGIYSIVMGERLFRNILLCLMWTDFFAIWVLAHVAPNVIITSEVSPLTVRNDFHRHWVPRTNLDHNYSHKSANLTTINIQFCFSYVTNRFRKITSHFWKLTSGLKIRIFMIGHCVKPRTFQYFLIDCLNNVTSIVFIYPLIYEFYLRTRTQTLF